MGELYHHGILGQKWGQRNGPPYPLKSGAHSSSEKKAGWKKSLSGSGSKKNAKNSSTSGKVSTKQGIAGEIIASVALPIVSASVTAAVVIGLNEYSLHLDKKAANKRLKEVLSERKEADVDEKSGFRLKNSNKKGEEAIKDDLAAVNPAHSNDMSTNQNCTYCSIAMDLRRRGFDVVAELTPKPQMGVELTHKIFKNAKTTRVDPLQLYTDETRNKTDEKLAINKKRISSMQVIRAREKAMQGENTEFADAMYSSMSKEKNTSGVMTVTWAVGGGHMITYDVSKKGEVRILDAQINKIYKGKEAKDYLSNCILGTYTRTDNLEVDYKEARKVVR